jgi:hypothetical protein
MTRHRSVRCEALCGITRTLAGTTILRKADEKFPPDTWRQIYADFLLCLPMNQTPNQALVTVFTEQDKV